LHKFAETFALPVSDGLQDRKRNRFLRHENLNMRKGGQRCTVCSHREYAAIDLAIARGVSVTAISRRYKLSTDAIYRHRTNHLSAALRAKLLAGPDSDIDLDRLRETESQSLLSNLVTLRHRLFASLDTAEEVGDGTMISRLAGQLHQNLEITGKLLGDLVVGSTTINNVLVMPQYVELRVALVKALAPYSEAKVDRRSGPSCARSQGRGSNQSAG
jgi:hypothetical protein